MAVDKITLRKNNEVFMSVKCSDAGIERELQDFFTFFAENYKFHPKYKNKQWDGKIRLFDLRYKRIYVGLLSYIYEFASVRDYQVEIIDNDYYSTIGVNNNIDFDEIIQFITKLKLPKDKTPRDYQVDALIHALTHKRAVLDSPTSSGKSLIMYMILRWFLTQSHKNPYVLIVVPTTSLVEQLRSDFLEYAKFDEYFDEDDIHMIYSGKEKFKLANVTITTWQTAIRMPDPWFRQFGMLLGDEAHTFKAKSLVTIMEKLTECEYRIGTSGTASGSSVNHMVLDGTLGLQYKVTTTKKLMDAGSISKLHINCVVLKHPEDVRKKFKKLEYKDELDYLITLESRNKFIRNLALSLSGNTLILFSYVEKHGKPLYNMIKQKAGDDRQIFLVYGGVDVSDRETIRKQVETEKDAIIVASYQTYSTGINIRNLHNVIFASPAKSHVRVLQSIGRSLRLSDDGRDATLYDISDDLHWKTKRNYSLEHAGVRIQIYTKEQFKYKIYEVNL